MTTNPQKITLMNAKHYHLHWEMFYVHLPIRAVLALRHRSPPPAGLSKKGNLLEVHRVRERIYKGLGLKLRKPSRIKTDSFSLLPFRVLRSLISALLSLTPSLPGEAGCFLLLLSSWVYPVALLWATLIVTICTASG